MTLRQANRLKYRQVVYTTDQNADGSPCRWRVDGAVKTWKRSPDRVRVPMKRGMYEHTYLDENNVQDFYWTEKQALRAMKQRRKH